MKEVDAHAQYFERDKRVLMKRHEEKIYKKLV
jgi:hypothetical protein